MLLGRGPDVGQPYELGLVDEAHYHVPTGIVVTSREQRSQLQNRLSCLAKIRAELGRRGRPPKLRHATKPTKASVRRRLESKHCRSDVKKKRRRPGMED